MPSLEELEGDVWPPTDVHTNLIDSCHRLRKKAIEELSASELRLLIGQKIGLRFLAPRALDILEEDPLVWATFAPGDLLEAVFVADENLFQWKPAIYQRLRQLAKRVEVMAAEDPEGVSLSDNLVRIITQIAS